MTIDCFCFIIIVFVTIIFWFYCHVSYQYTVLVRSCIIMIISVTECVQHFFNPNSHLANDQMHLLLLCVFVFAVLYFCPTFNPNPHLAKDHLIVVCVCPPLSRLPISSIGLIQQFTSYLHRKVLLAKTCWEIQSHTYSSQCLTSIKDGFYIWKDKRVVTRVTTMSAARVEWKI